MTWTALIVDDSKVVRRALAGILNSIGFQVTEATNGQEALDILNLSGEIQIAFVDWNMPIMDGYQFIKAIRASETLQQFKIMMMTVENQPESIKSALDIGANEFIMKPFNKQIIKDKLNLLGFYTS